MSLSSRVRPHRRSAPALLATLLTSMVSLPVVADDKDWATYNYDARGWRFNHGETALSPQNAPQIVEKWRFPAKGSEETIGAVHVTPAVVAGYTYFGTATEPTFYKLCPDGSLAWSFPLNEPEATKKVKLPEGTSRDAANPIRRRRAIISSPLVTDDGVFFGDTLGVFYALERESGKLRWKVDTRVEGFPGHHPINVFMCAPVLARGLVVCGGGGYEHAQPLDPSYECCTGRGFVVAFEPRSGRVVWKYEVGEKPQRFDPPVVIEDAKGRHLYKFGPSTSSVWSAPSYDPKTRLLFFGTDVHNSPRKPTKENPRLDTKYSASIVAVDVRDGSEKWVTQLNRGDIYNHTMSGYDPNTGRYKDCSIGDTPKIYSIDVEGKPVNVLGVGCKNGGFYVLRAHDGKILANTPVYESPPSFPVDPKPDPRTIALPSPIGGIQTGCATDGRSVFTNGIDFIKLNLKNPGAPEGGRVVCIDPSTRTERWRHERPKSRLYVFPSGDPIASGIALGGGLACFTTTVSEKLVVLDADSGKTLKELPVGVVWSGPSISRGRIFVGTGSVLFFKKALTGQLISFGLPGVDELDRMGKGDE